MPPKLNQLQDQKSFDASSMNGVEVKHESFSKDRQKSKEKSREKALELCVMKLEQLEDQTKTTSHEEGSHHQCGKSFVCLSEVTDAKDHLCKVKLHLMQQIII